MGVIGSNVNEPKISLSLFRGAFYGIAYWPFASFKKYVSCWKMCYSYLFKIFTIVQYLMNIFNSHANMLFYRIYSNNSHTLISVVSCFKCCRQYSLSFIQLFSTPWTVAHQVPLSMGISRLEYWSGLPFSFPGDIPNPGIKSRSPALQADYFPFEPLEFLIIGC